MADTLASLKRLRGAEQPATGPASMSSGGRAGLRSAVKYAAFRDPEGNAWTSQEMSWRSKDWF
jgi:hypothetical protein